LQGRDDQVLELVQTLVYSGPALPFQHGLHNLRGKRGDT
jgi:hypothetical protein